MALAIDEEQKGDVTVVLVIFDLRTGRASDRIIAGLDYRASGGDSYTLERLALSRSGAVAWRGTHLMGHPGTPETLQQVSIADSHGTRVLDSGSPGALGGPHFTNPTTVVWSHAGRHSAHAFRGLPRQG